jgi:hypothetical protein
MGGLLVDAAHVLVQFEFVDDFPTLSHPGPNINLVLFVQQRLEGFLGIRPQAIVQPEDGVVHIKEYIHRQLMGSLSSGILRILLIRVRIIAQPSRRFIASNNPVISII